MATVQSQLARKPGQKCRTSRIRTAMPHHHIYCPDTEKPLLDLLHAQYTLRMIRCLDELSACTSNSGACAFSLSAGIKIEPHPIPGEADIPHSNALRKFQFEFFLSISSTSDNPRRRRKSQKDVVNSISEYCLNCNTQLVGGGRRIAAARRGARHRSVDPGSLSTFDRFCKFGSSQGRIFAHSREPISGGRQRRQPDASQ